MTLSVSPIVFSLALVSFLYLYVGMGKAHWNEMVARAPLNELIVDLSMHQWGWRRWPALIVYGAFVAMWPAFLALGWTLAKADVTL